MGKVVEERGELAVDGFDLDDGEFLAVALLAAVALTALALDDGDFLAALVFEDFGDYVGTVHIGGTETGLRAFADHQYIVDGDHVARVGVLETVDEQNVAFLNCELTPLCFDGRFHRKRYEKRVVGY